MRESVQKKTKKNPGITSNRPIHLTDNYVLKEIIEKHKHLLSLTDSKAKLANMKAVPQY